MAKGRYAELSGVSGIYGLVDPRTGQTMYVGQATSIRDRFIGHVAAKDKCNHPKKEWIRGLKAEGLLPELIVIKKCCDKHLNQFEIQEIARLRRAGQKLFNQTSGGSAIRCSRRKSGSVNRGSALSPEETDAATKALLAAVLGEGPHPVCVRARNRKRFLVLAAQ